MMILRSIEKIVVSSKTVNSAHQTVEGSSIGSLMTLDHYGGNHRSCGEVLKHKADDIMRIHSERIRYLKSSNRKPRDKELAVILSIHRIRLNDVWQYKRNILSRAEVGGSNRAICLSDN